MPSFWTIIIVYINTVHSQKRIIRNKSHIVCDGSMDNDSCIDGTIICPEGFDCEIICNVPNIDVQIPTEHHYRSGCCGSHIYCPFGRECSILCNGGGCIHTHIHATNASYLQINGCNQLSITSLSYTSCDDMYIYCPIYNKCQFNGNYTLQNSHIHTQCGFNDISLQYGLTLASSTIYCDATATQCINIDTSCTNESQSEEEWNVNLNKDMTAYFDTGNKTQMMAYITVGILLLIPILIIIIALIYHHTQTGSDAPEYFSVFQCFINTIDFYTDVLFCVFLLQQNSSLYIAAMIFTVLPHVLSIVICILYIHKWRDNIYKIAYIKRYDNLVIGLTVLTGFVPTIQSLSSKLFYASRLTLHMCLKEKLRIQQLRFINNNIFEDIPLIILQIIAMDTPITFISFCFSFLSIIIGTVCFLLKCGYNDVQEHVTTYELNIKSNRMESRHYYCHRLLSECLCVVLNINDGGIETMSVIPIMDGISCRIEIKYDDMNEIDDIDALFKELTHNESNIFNDFKTSLCKLFHIEECTDLNISVSKLDLDGLEGNYTVTGLKRRNTVYIPLKRSTESIKNRIAEDIKSDLGDVIEETEGVPLKQESLLFETMKKARIYEMDNVKRISIEMTEKKAIDDICELVYLDETQTTTHSGSAASRENESKENYYRGNQHDKTSKSYESEILAQFEW